MTVSAQGQARTVGSAELTPGGGEMHDGRVSALRMKKLARERNIELFLVFVKQVDTPDARCATVSAAENISEDCMIAKEWLQRILDKHKAVFAELPGGVIHRPGLPELSIDFEAGKQPPVGYQRERNCRSNCHWPWRRAGLNLLHHHLERQCCLLGRKDVD